MPGPELICDWSAHSKHSEISSAHPKVVVKMSNVVNGAYAAAMVPWNGHRVPPGDSGVVDRKVSCPSSRLTLPNLRTAAQGSTRRAALAILLCSKGT